MQGRPEGEERHMWSVPASNTVSGEEASESRLSVGLPQPLPLSENVLESESAVFWSDPFIKDGRTIRVGDCALFQSGKAPPFIGIVRCFATSNDDNVNICVNWLYRPADVKLAKGILVDTAPNEVFYSFHKDVISSASLLHPCKVTFLKEGVELPSGISSFICRRVYDIANKCLWWLTDQDYINEEVDQLLNKNRLEMHAAVSSGGRSPKQVNAPTNPQQLKSGLESFQNSGISSASQTKSRKRDRGDQGPESVKQKRFGKSDDGGSSGLSESMIKGEIAKITERGGLTSIEGAEKLVNLMQLDRMERKIDVSGRILITEVIAATDRCNDCLSRIVQLRGLSILDDWLQEAHKGRTSDGNSPKENDKAVEELLLSLLRALDKLPVDLHALQSCNIGKSVNHLRSYKNVEIHKKAKILVDTWKKRVDAEMTKINDAKSAGQNQPASCPAKANLPDGSQSGNRSGGTTDGPVKGLVTQPSSCKTLTGKPAGPKEQLPKVTATCGSCETPSAVKEEKSSSSSHSQNNSQSCSSDHGKVIGSYWKEDARSSTAGSLKSVKGNCSSAWQRRPSNGLLGASTGVQKESNQGKASSLNQASALEKASQSGLICEKTLDASAAELGNNHKFIVKFPNPGRIPVSNVSGGSLEDPSVRVSRASSPGIADRHEHSDRRMKTRSDACRSHVAVDGNGVLWLGSDVKEGFLGADGMKSLTTIIDGECNITAEDSGKPGDASRNACSSPGKLTSVISKLRMRDSYSPINALIESCAKFSEVRVPPDADDDIGMNLLASVAAGEILKSELTSPSGSPRASASPAVHDPLTANNEVRSRLSFDKDVTQSHAQSDEGADAASSSRGKTVGSVFSKDESVGDVTCFSGNSKTDVIFQEEKTSSEQIEQLSISFRSPSKATDLSHKSEGKCEDGKNGSLPFSKLKVEENADGTSEAGVKQIANKKAFENYEDSKPSASVPDDKYPILRTQNQIWDGNICSSDFHRSKLDDSHEAVITANIMSEKLVGEDYPSSTTKEILGGPCSVDQSLMPLILVKTDAIATDAADKSYKSDSLEIGHMEANTNEKQHLVSLSNSVTDELARAVVAAAIGHRQTDKGFDVGQTEPDSQGPCPDSSVERGEHHSKSSGFKVSGTSVDLREEFQSSTEATSVSFSVEPDASAKLDFDLNEGILTDDRNLGEPATSVHALPTQAFLTTLPHVNPTSKNLLVPITVAAPAKGPFVPLENLLKCKGEQGWKGSAATSAFRPAEPRKVPDMVFSESDAQLDATVNLGRVPLVIDLNVADDSAIEDSQNTAHTIESESRAVPNEAPMKVVTGLDLDLNRIDGGTDGQFLINTSNKPGLLLLPVRSASAGETNVSRDFDLNNGPSPDEVCGEKATRNQHSRSNNTAPFLPSFTDIRMNNPGLGGFPTWFPPGNSYSAVAIPSLLPDSGEHSFPIVAAPGAQRILGSVTGGGTLGGDICRGAVLSSSPAMAFSPASAFPYVGFPFGSSFPFASNFSGVSTSYGYPSSGSGSGFASIPSQPVSSHYPRPFLINIPEGSSSVGSDNNRKWGRQSLDLNTGPGSADTEGKDVRPSLVSRQLQAAISHAFSEEHAKMYAGPGMSFKRKEPEGSWDSERSAYKQLSWQ